MHVLPCAVGGPIQRWRSIPSGAKQGIQRILRRQSSHGERAAIT
jgi:hypothetical protein